MAARNGGGALRLLWWRPLQRWRSCHATAPVQTRIVWYERRGWFPLLFDPGPHATRAAAASRVN
jgi:hypothetical protein